LPCHAPVLPDPQPRPGPPLLAGTVTHRLRPMGLYGSWFYHLPPGADKSCSLVTSVWVTASWNNWGVDPVSGNIFAPDAAHC